MKIFLAQEMPYILTRRQGTSGGVTVSKLD